jgi:succinate dehydrogenase hydrophobic anchor subunit
MNYNDMNERQKKGKWIGKILSGVINGAIAITLLFNGFTFMLENILGGYNKHNAWVVMFSRLESAWWKYIIVLLFAFLSYWEISKGIKLLKNKS